MLEGKGPQDLLAKARRGLAWLRQNHNGWDPDKPARRRDADFGRILAETAGMEPVLRGLGLEGCILGVEGPCPEDAVITCDHCAGVVGPAAEPSPMEGEEPALPAVDSGQLGFGIGNGNYPLTAGTP